MSRSAEGLLSLVQAYFRGRDDARVSEWLGQAGELQLRSLGRRELPCLVHLEHTAEIAAPAERPLATFLAGEGRSLHWGQTYSEVDFDRAFLDNYGWLELFGTRGHFASDSVACGFLLLGPDTHYPDHHHLAEEVYVPLTGGTKWRQGDGGFVPRRAGEVIHHPPNINHAMRTAAEPLLALYLWRGGPLAAKSTLTGARRGA